jgi:hypothetical protein
MVKDIPYFVFCYNFYLIIYKIKAKSLIGENKYMCEYCKIIWISSLKCNSHIQVRFKITHQWFRELLSEDPTLNAIPRCKVALKYPIFNLGVPLNEDQGLNAIPTCKFILK